MKSALESLAFAQGCKLTGTISLLEASLSALERTGHGPAAAHVGMALNMVAIQEGGAFSNANIATDTARSVTMEPSDYAWLLEGLDQTGEHLRSMRAISEQRRVKLAWAFYRTEAAAAAIRGLLAENAQLQAALSSSQGSQPTRLPASPAIVAKTVGPGSLGSEAA